MGTIVVHTVENPLESAAPAATTRLSFSGALDLSCRIICAEVLREKAEADVRVGKWLIFLRTAAPRPGLLNAQRIARKCVAAGLATGREAASLLICRLSRRPASGVPLDAHNAFQ